MARKILVSLAACGLLSAPATAQAAQRLPSPTAKTERLVEEGSIGRWILGIGLFAGIITWIIIDASGDEDEEPASP